MNSTKGLVILNIGSGKGKTTSALGTLFRAYGDGLRVGILRFNRSPRKLYGEAISCLRLSIPYQSYGNLRKGAGGKREKNRIVCLLPWLQAQDWISENLYDILVLDEMTNLFDTNLLNAEDVIAWLKRNKPMEMHLVITGARAPEELIDYADFVTEMKEIKSPPRDEMISQTGVVY